MSKGILYSVILHVMFFGGALITSPFDFNKKMNETDIIRVTIKSLPEFKVKEPEPVNPPATPAAITVEEIPDIPLSDPRTIEEKKKIKEKPKPKPPKKEKPEAKTQPQASQTEEPKEKEIESKTTRSGAMFAGATVDNKAFHYPYWFDLAFSKIHSNFRSPISSDAIITAVIYFEVIQSGRVVLVRVEESSGIERFDEACLLAINRSAPFPPLPRSFGEEIIGITLPMAYDPY